MFRGHFTVSSRVRTGQFAEENTGYFLTTDLKSFIFSPYEPFHLLLSIPTSIFEIRYQNKELCLKKDRVRTGHLCDMRFKIIC